MQVKSPFEKGGFRGFQAVIKIPPYPPLAKGGKILSVHCHFNFETHHLGYIAQTNPRPRRRVERDI